MKINKDTIIYIYSVKTKTGGTQSLHQLAKKMTENGMNVVVIYRERRNEALYYPEIIKVADSDSIEDVEDNILIVPEVMTDYLRGYRHIRCVIWFLSRDFFVNKFVIGSSMLAVRNHHSGIFSLPFWILLRVLRDKKKFGMRQYIRSIMDCCWLYNCEYVNKWLEAVGGGRNAAKIFMCSCRP